MTRSSLGVALAILLAACGRSKERPATPPDIATAPDGSGAPTGTTMSNVTIAATVTASQPGRPPLQRLTLDVAIDNRSTTATWIVIPKQIPVDPDDGGTGVDSLEIRGKGTALLGTFLGTGGVHVLRVAPHAKVIVTGLPVGWWRSSPQDAVPPLLVTIAEDLKIDGKSADGWFGVQPLIESGARIDAAGAQSGAHTYEGGEAPIVLTGAQSASTALTLPAP